MDDSGNLKNDVKKPDDLDLVKKLDALFPTPETETNKQKDTSKLFSPIQRRIINSILARSRCVLAYEFFC